MLFALGMLMIGVADPIYTMSMLRVWCIMWKWLAERVV